MNSENKNHNLSNQATRKGKFNAMDVLIILIVLLCVATLVYRYGLIGKIGVSDNLGDYEIKFEIENIRLSSKDALVEGDIVRFVSSSEIIGTLNKQDFAALAIAMYTEGGVAVSYPTDEHNAGNSIYEYNGSIAAKGIMTEKGFMLNGKTYIAPNSELKISTEHIETTIKVVGINKK